MLHECGVDGYLIRSISSLYDGSRECVRLGSRVVKHFEVRRRLRQRCVISQWLFNIFLQSKKPVNERAMRREVKLRDENWGRVGKLSKYYMQMTQFW